MQRGLSVVYMNMDGICVYIMLSCQPVQKCITYVTEASQIEQDLRSYILHRGALILLFNLPKYV